MTILTNNLETSSKMRMFDIPQYEKDCGFSSEFEKALNRFLRSGRDYIWTGADGKRKRKLVIWHRQDNDFFIAVRSLDNPEDIRGFSLKTIDKIEYVT